MSRASDLDRLYELFDRLEAKVGGKRRLEDCTGHVDWPERGVYFVFANGETRAALQRRFASLHASLQCDAAERAAEVVSELLDKDTA
jgi:hypothetical protein